MKVRYSIIELLKIEADEMKEYSTCQLNLTTPSSLSTCNLFLFTELQQVDRVSRDQLSFKPKLLDGGLFNVVLGTKPQKSYS